MKKRILSFFMVLCLLLALTPVVMAADAPTQEEAYRSMIAMKSQYPEGMPWDNNNYYAWNGYAPENGVYYGGGYGCAGFAFLLSDEAFGDLPSYFLYDITIRDIRVGDILRLYNDSHSAIVLEVHDTYVVIAEGNYNHSIHWGRVLTAKDVSEANYAMSRYPKPETATILAQPRTTYVKLGQTACVTVGADGDGLVYQWFVKDAHSARYVKSSVKSDTYSVKMTDKTKDRQVYCLITDTYGNTVCSDTVFLRMAASIATQPKTASAANGEVAKITIGAKGDGLTYHWYIKNKGASKFSKSSVTSATYSCKVTDATDNRLVYCIVKDRYGYSVTSETVSIQEKVAITTQPKNTYTAMGATAKTTVKATGDGLTYQWYIKNAGATKYVKSSVTTATYSAKMSATVKDRYAYCVITDAYGNTVRSKTVVLRMKASVISQPTSVTVAKGKAAKVTLKAAGDGLTYTWYYKNAKDTRFIKTSSFKGTSYQVTVDATRSGRQVYCVITDKYGYSVKTNTVTLKMK